MVLGDKIFSPNKEFRLEFTSGGSLVLERTEGYSSHFGSNDEFILWKSDDEEGFKSGAVRCTMQPDGNLVLRRDNGSATWKTNTHFNHGAQFILDDGGQIAILSSGVTLWLAGAPRGKLNEERRKRGKKQSLQFPLRGIFYYPWFPETWSVNGRRVFYQVSDGYYSSDDASLQRKHVQTLHHIHTNIAIASWFGPSTHQDRARITNMMVRTSLYQQQLRDDDSNVRTKWTVYYEKEFHSNSSVEEIRKDLEYLKKWFVWHDTWAYIDGRPLIFVYNEGNCDVSERWRKADSRKEWYIVLKVFTNDKKCFYQPDGWHQYGPNVGVQRHRGSSYVIAPGFWRADLQSPHLPRYDRYEWYSMVQNMVKSNEPFQLIVSFNEWGEGTAIEPAQKWSSTSGYGYYIDALHDLPTIK